MFAVWYNYIESWTLAYSVFSVTGEYFGIHDFDGMRNFLQSFQGVQAGGHFSSISNPLFVFPFTAMLCFLLTVGLNVWILTYASYLKPKDDLALTGLTTSITNEFAEVILGGSLAIPIAVAFFGLAKTEEIARAAFDLPFAAMPMIFQKLPLGRLFGMMWFSLLFFAGITSSVALCSPAMAFLQGQMKMQRQKAALVVGAVLSLCGLPVALFFAHGFLNEMNFWSGTFGLVVFALVEVILFAWLFGMERAWQEINLGADIRLPLVFKFIIQFVSPIYLIVLLLFWGIQQGVPTLLMTGQNSADVPYLWAARVMMAGLIIASVWLVARAYKRGTIRHEYR